MQRIKVAIGFNFLGASTSLLLSVAMFPNDSRQNQGTIISDFVELLPITVAMLITYFAGLNLCQPAVALGDAEGEKERAMRQICIATGGS